MAALTTQQRTDIAAQWNRDVSIIRDVVGGAVRADIVAAVGAIDDFLDANAAAINNAIPLPARTALSTAQKARLVVAVARLRYGF